MCDSSASCAVATGSAPADFGAGPLIGSLICSNRDRVKLRASGHLERATPGGQEPSGAVSATVASKMFHPFYYRLNDLLPGGRPQRP